MIGAVILALSSLPTRADNRPITILALPEASSETLIESQFKFIQQAKRNWSICAILPNEQDRYWQLVKEGLNTRAKELDIKVQIYSSTGYDAAGADQQRRIFELRCMEDQIDLILIAAVDETKLYDIINKARHKGIMVVDFMNGLKSDYVDAKISLDFAEMGKAASAFLRQAFEKHPDEDICLYWFPGPEKPDWSIRGNLGFQQNIQGAPLKIFKTTYGLPFIRTQTEQILEQFEDADCISYIAGMAPTALAALKLKSQGRLPENTQILAYYFDTRLVPSLESGELLAIANDFPYEQAKLSVDYSALLLQKESPYYQIAIKPKILNNLHLN